MYSLKEKIFLFLILFSICAASQNETNNWYFGDKAGLNFNDGLLNTLVDGNMNTTSGCSTISNREGELLFYTNGQSVWNKNHVLMDNGYNLAGDINNTQTSIIIPKPNSDSIYYIFTTREFPSSSPLLTSGLFYSEIEISNKYPLGVVVVKNIRLTDITTERITAIHDSKSNTIKVIAFGSLTTLSGALKDTFFVFNVTENGVSRPPLISKQKATVSSIGAMKISPNGKYIAIADFEDRYIYLYHFNNENSTIEFFKRINADLFFTPITPYGIEFSQDSSMLYYTGNLSNYNFLFQYIINSTNTDPIFSPKTLVEVSSEYDFGSLQLARNGKIYIANYKQNDPLTSFNNISVINNPESIDDVGYEPLVINLKSGYSYKGLPNFIPSFFRNRIITENKCENEIFDFSLDAYAQIESVFWEFGDGTTSTLINPTYQYPNAGKYTVKATIVINNYPTTLYKKVQAYPLPIINANERLIQCDIDNDGVSYFNLHNIKDKIINPNIDYELYFFNTHDNAINDNNSITNSELYENTSNPQEIFVKIVSPKGCFTISNFFIETAYARLGNISKMFTCEDSDDISNNNEGLFNFKRKGNEIRDQFSIPEKSTISFYQTFQDAQTKTNPLNPYHATVSTTVWTRVDNEDFGCHGIEPIQLIVNSGLKLNIQDNYTICNQNLQPLTILDGDISNDSWEWKDSTGTIISTNRKFEITQPGTFSLTVYKTENMLECFSTKQFTVNESGIPVFNKIHAENSQIHVEINGESIYEFSLDNINFYGHDTVYTFFNISPGIHTVYVRDINNCEPPINAKASLIGFPKYFTPNGDGYNDVWKIHGVSKDFYSSASIQIYDRYGKILYSMNLENNMDGWNGIYNGEILSSADYWFNAILIDNENNTIIKTGHFSLIK